MVSDKVENMTGPIYTINRSETKLPVVNATNADGENRIASLLDIAELSENFVCVDGVGDNVLEVMLPEDESSCYVTRDEAKKFTDGIGAGKYPRPLQAVWCEGWHVLASVFGVGDAMLNDKDAVKFFSGAYERGWRVSHYEKLKDIYNGNGLGDGFPCTLANVESAFMSGWTVNEIDSSSGHSPMIMALNLALLGVEPTNDFFSLISIEAKEKSIRLQLDDVVWNYLRSSPSKHREGIKSVHDYMIFKNAFFSGAARGIEMNVSSEEMESFIPKKFWVPEMAGAVKDVAYNALELLVGTYDVRGSALLEEAFVAGRLYKEDSRSREFLLASARAYEALGRKAFVENNGRVLPHFVFAYALFNYLGATGDALKIKTDVQKKIGDMLYKAIKNNDNEMLKDASSLALLFVGFNKVFSSVLAESKKVKQKPGPRPSGATVVAGL